MARQKEAEPLVTVTLRLYAADVEEARRLAERDLIPHHPILRRAVRAGLRAMREQRAQTGKGR